MTSPILFSSACISLLLLCSVPETSADVRPDLRPLLACVVRRSGVETALSAWAASAGLQVTSVKQSALEGAVNSGVGDQDGGGDCGSCDGDCVPAGGGVHPGRGPGCGDDGRGAGTRGEGLAGAGAGVSACDGGRFAPAAMTSSPSCGPWSSCFRWRWHPGDVKVQPSASVWPLSAWRECEWKNRSCCGRDLAYPSYWSPWTSVSPWASAQRRSQAWLGLAEFQAWRLAEAVSVCFVGAAARTASRGQALSAC